jgi:flagellar hook assembly protein FlgD
MISEMMARVLHLWLSGERVHGGPDRDKSWRDDMSTVISDTKSASQQKIDFMNLMIEEMRNQNPLEPLNNQQMAAQMAQFSQLEQSESMNTNLQTINDTIGKLNTSFAGAMVVAQYEFAKSLLGQDVSFTPGTDGTTLKGKAEKLHFENNQPVLDVRVKTQTNSGTTESVVAVKLEQIVEIASQ